MGWEDDLKIYFRVVVCEDGRWMELAQDRVQWWDLVLAALNLGVLLPQCLFKELQQPRLRLLLKIFPYCQLN